MPVCQKCRNWLQCYWSTKRSKVTPSRHILWKNKPCKTDRSVQTIFMSLCKGATTPATLCRITISPLCFCPGEVSESDCVCAEGYGLQAGETGCIACAIGFYKNVSGGEECTPCPPQFTTYGTGSVSSSSCYEVTPASSNSSTLQSEASVPAVSFTFSIGEIPATEDQETLRQQLIATWRQRESL